MDIFIIETVSANNINKEMLLKYKMKTISNSRKLREHCLSYLMTDKILENVYKISDRKISFKNNKPFLESDDKFLSISHSKDYIALGFSDYECGIDIEKMADRDFKKISERMNFDFISKEDFYKKWTLYEAKYKLGTEPSAEKSYFYKDYCITACSSYTNETFELYIQSINNFSKA